MKNAIKLLDGYIYNNNTFYFLQHNNILKGHRAKLT